LKQSALTDTFEFEKGMLSLIGISVDENSELKDKTLTETAYLNPDHNFTTIAILRDNKTIIPHGENKFMLNDHAYFIVEPSGIDRVMSLAGKERFDIKNIMILGGSKIGINTALQLSKNTISRSSKRIKRNASNLLICFQTPWLSMAMAEIQKY